MGAFSRNASSLIDDHILVDAGNGVIKTIGEQGDDWRRINAILITHLHLDHFLDLPSIIFAKQYDNDISPLTIYGPIGLIAALDAIMMASVDDVHDWHTKAKRLNMNFVEFSELSNFEVSPSYYVTSHLVDHGSLRPAYGYTISHSGKVVGFSGDSIYCSAINDIMAKSDIAVLDAAGVIPNKAHMSVFDIAALSDKYIDKTIVTTHMSDISRVRLMELDLPNVIIPADGREIAI